MDLGLDILLYFSFATSQLLLRNLMWTRERIDRSRSTGFRSGASIRASSARGLRFALTGRQQRLRRSRALASIRLGICA